MSVVVWLGMATAILAALRSSWSP